MLSNSKFLNEKYTRLYGLIGEEISFDSDVRIKRTSLFQCECIEFNDETNKSLKLIVEKTNYTGFCSDTLNKIFT